MTTAVLAINAGSSSIKFGLFETAGNDGLSLLSKGTLEDVGPELRFKAMDASGSAMRDIQFPEGSCRQSIFGALLKWVDEQLGNRELIAIGHRVVHGGSDFNEPVLINADILAAIDRLTPLAPLHQARCLEPVRAIQALRPKLLHVACFDTAFHHALTPPVSRYAIPRSYEVEGIRKYGFHGLSYEFVAGRLKEISPELAAARTVVAHLGNGASLCAIRDGRSIDTSMGFSTLDGLMMGTRCGALDPGVVLYLQKARGLTAEQVEDILYHQSGLAGVSGVSSDMRTLVTSADHRAQEAIELFTFRIARETAAMANTLAGLDCLVFTGGIGEHAPGIRAAVCDRLQWLGVKLDPRRNSQGVYCISHPKRRVKILLIPTNEEFVIARHIVRQVNGTRCSTA